MSVVTFRTRLIVSYGNRCSVEDDGYPELPNEWPISNGCTEEEIIGMARNIKQISESKATADVTVRQEWSKYQYCLNVFCWEDDSGDVTQYEIFPLIWSVTHSGRG